MTKQHMNRAEILDFVTDYVVKSGLDSIPGLAYALLNREAERRTAHLPNPDLRVIDEVKETAALIDEVRGIFEEEKSAMLDKIEPKYKLTDPD